MEELKDKVVVASLFWQLWNQNQLVSLFWFLFSKERLIQESTKSWYVQESGLNYHSSPI